jgi:hypothetical protein
MWVWIWQDQEQVTKGFRFMGQRFTLDAYVFGQVLWRKVGTISDPRALPKGLDFFAAMGSEEAYAILQDMGETHSANYDTQMTKVKTSWLPWQRRLNAEPHGPVIPPAADRPQRFSLPAFHADRCLEAQGPANSPGFMDRAKT